MKIISKLFLVLSDISNQITRGHIPKAWRLQLHCWKSLGLPQLMPLGKITTRHETELSRTEELTQLYHRFLILSVIYCFVDQINYSMHNNFPLFSFCISLQHALFVTQNISSSFLSKIIKTIYVHNYKDMNLIL